MKTFFTAILATCLALPALAQDKEDKIGTVKMGNLIQAYYKTKAMRDSFSKYRAEVREQVKEREVAIIAAREEAQKFHQEAQVPTLSEENRAKIFNQASRKQNEALSLQKELREWLNRRSSAIDEKANMEFAGIRKEVLNIIQKVGEEEGYDYIFDGSGASIAGVNVLVYTKDATDLTGVLLERINQNAPKEEAAKEGE